MNVADIFSEKQFTIKDVYDILARYEFSPYSVNGHSNLLLSIIHSRAMGPKGPVWQKPSKQNIIRRIRT